MPDNTIDGIFTSLNRINPETLSREAKIFLKNFREDLKERHSIDKGLGNLTARSLINFHNEQGETILSLMVELITVGFFVISSFRQYAIKVAEYMLLGTIFAILTITEDEKEIADIVEQLVVAIFTNPIFEFTPEERHAVAGLIFQAQGYLSTLNFYSGRFHHFLKIIQDSLESGLIQGLEICNVTAEELANVEKKSNYRLEYFIGQLKFYLNLCWPMFNITTNSVMKWLNKITRIEIWPVNSGQ